MILAKFAFISRPYRLLWGPLAIRSRMPMVRLEAREAAVVQERVGTTRHLPARGTAHSRHCTASGLINSEWTRSCGCPGDRAGVGYIVPTVIASLRRAGCRKCALSVSQKRPPLQAASITDFSPIPLKK